MHVSGCVQKYHDHQAFQLGVHKKSTGLTIRCRDDGHELKCWTEVVNAPDDISLIKHARKKGRAIASAAFF
jgi:hypothetical protein